MATPRTPTTSPIPPAPMELGNFVSTIPIGFVAPSPDESRRILAAMGELPTGIITNEFLKDLLVIKQLAPAESSGLLVYPAPMVVDFVRQLRTQLQLRYYRLER